MSIKAIAKRFIGNHSPLRLGWHRSRGWVAAMREGFPASKMRCIGVTGTDGKTTTTGMIAHILRAAGKTVGAASTTFFQVNDERIANESHMTSVEHGEFQRFLRRCANTGCEFFVAEAASHGLVQGRLGPIHFEVAAITNTSLEHLDYHRTMELYRRDKAILFRLLKGKGTKVLNVGDETFGQYKTIPSRATIGYGTPVGPFAGCEESLWMSGAQAQAMSVSATLHTQDGRKIPLLLNIPGLFNLENAMCAIAAAHAVGVGTEQAAKALATFPGIPGRMERIDEGQPFSVFVDFTVTPLAYEKTLEAVRAMAPGGRVLVLTGACGNRMREKRPVIGQICSKLADVVVVSTDETVTEDPLKVIDEVWAGVDQSKGGCRRIPDRREAIAWLFSQAKPGDAVALCGMGACTTMQAIGRWIPWDEREVAREILREKGLARPQ